MKRLVFIEDEGLDTESLLQRLSAKGFRAEPGGYGSLYGKDTPDGRQDVDLIEKAPIGIFRSTLEGKFIYANLALARILKYDSAAELMDVVNRESIAEVLYLKPEERQEVLSNIPSHGDWQIFEVTYRCKDGSTITCKDYIREVPGSDPIDFHLEGFVEDITERKSNETQLRLSQFIIDHAPIGIFRGDADAHILMVNDFGAAMLGYAPDELCTMTFFDIDPNLTNDSWHEHRKKLIARGSNSFESINRRKDGTLFPVEINVNYHQYGAQVFSCSISRDISERKKAEADLKRSEEKYRAVADFTYDWETWVEPDGRFIYVSPSCERITGYTAEEFISDPTLLGRIIHPENRKSEAEQLAETATGTELEHHLDFRIITKNGEERWIEHICQPVYGTSGKWLGRRGSNRDITDRMRVEMALRESEELFRVLAETSPIAIMLFQGDRIIYVNPATERLFGYTDEELLRMSFWDWAHEDFRDLVRYRGLARQRGEKVPNQYESKSVTKSGEVRWLVVSAGAIEYRGNPAGVALLHDITDIKRIEGQLRDSLAEKDVLLKEVHHRVKNNLQVVASLLDLQSEQINDKTILSSFRKSQDRIKAMALIHERLYRSADISSVDFGNYLSDLTTHLFASYPLIPGHVELAVQCSEIILGIDKAIPCGLIVNELISNSLKHAFPNHRPGKISLSMVHDDSGMITLTISDTGVGISPDIKLEKTGSLGMQLVTMLVRQLQGRMSFESGSDGTVCTIKFPMDFPGRQEDSRAVSPEPDI